MSNLQGVFPPAPTFFASQTGFDWKANEAHTDFLINNKVQGITYLGTNGEFSSLSQDHKKEFIQHMHTYVNGRCKVLIGVADTCIDRVYDLLDLCAKLRVDGVLLMNPYFTVYSDEMVINYYQTLSKATGLNIIIYNFPSLTGYNFRYEVVREIAQTSPNIIGLKNTIDSIAHLASLLPIRKHCPEFVFYGAFENQFLLALTMGVNSFISATASFAPELSLNLIHAYKEENLNAVTHWSNQLNQAMQVYNHAQPLLLACKEAIYQRVLQRECPEKLPALNLSPTQKLAVREILQGLDLS